VTLPSDTPDADELFYLHALRRIYLHIVWLSVAGFALTAWALGWPWALGFFVGATVSALNFRWLHGLVDSLSPGARRAKKGMAILLPFRYVLLVGIGYVIVKYLGVNIMAALVGLFVAVAAVLLEMVYELIYART
jgi:hypothetical protein